MQETKEAKQKTALVTVPKDPMDVKLAFLSTRTTGQFAAYILGEDYRADTSFMRRSAPLSDRMSTKLKGMTGLNVFQEISQLEVGTLTNPTGKMAARITWLKKIFVRNDDVRKKMIAEEDVHFTQKAVLAKEKNPTKKVSVEHGGVVLSGLNYPDTKNAYDKGRAIHIVDPAAETEKKAEQTTAQDKENQPPTDRRASIPSSSSANLILPVSTILLNGNPMMDGQRTEQKESEQDREQIKRDKIKFDTFVAQDFAEIAVYVRDLLAIKNDDKVPKIVCEILDSAVVETPPTFKKIATDHLNATTNTDTIAVLKRMQATDKPAHAVTDLKKLGEACAVMAQLYDPQKVNGYNRDKPDVTSKVKRYLPSFNGLKVELLHAKAKALKLKQQNELPKHGL